MSHDAPHSTSVKTYLTVFGGLALLTGLTVVLSYLHLPHHFAIAAAVMIAVTKCSLIMMFFMHLRFESKSIFALLFTALFFVLFLAVFLLPDIAFTK